MHLAVMISENTRSFDIEDFHRLGTKVRETFKDQQSNSVQLYSSLLKRCEKMIIFWRKKFERLFADRSATSFSQLRLKKLIETFLHTSNGF